MKTLFDLCTPREDVLRGTVRESEFAADLAQVLDGKAPDEYRRADPFFANTHPTEGLKDLLRNVCARLTGKGGEASSLFRLDTQYGGGKTHALIALSHAAAGMPGVANADEFLPLDLVPKGKVRIAAFDGENADPGSGRALGHGLRAFTPWGELAYRLAGVEGYELIRRSDQERSPPGADTIRELFGSQPSLVLLDELAVYLRKVRNRPEARQLTPFLTGLFKAVESAPGAAVVFTLAIGKGGKATDAYSEENEFIARHIEEAERVAARQATMIDPTAEHETARVLRRRLFSHIDDAAAEEVVEAYRQLWMKHVDDLPAERVGEDRAAEFRNGYPFHPALMSALTDKLSTLSNFQRVRGMLRLLTQTVARLWAEQPVDTYGVHLHHLDPGYGPVHNEVVTRLELRNFDPAIRNDVSSTGGGTSLAEHIDATHYAGMPPYGSFVARTILWHTFAFNEQLKGATPDELRCSTMAPGLDLAFINDARQRFIQDSGYLDDRPSAPLRFLTEANLEQLIRRQTQHVDPEQVRYELQDRIREIFGGRELNLVPFAGGPYDADDNVGDGRPQLVLIGYDAQSVRSDSAGVPSLVERIFRFKGTQSDFRSLQNNLVFLVADEGNREAMRHRMARRLALDVMRQPDRLAQLAEHQQEKVKELYQRSATDLALSIQQCYRHLFFPSRNERVEGAEVDLAHATFDVQSASERPGGGQQQVLRCLRENKKLLLSEDPPLAPNYVRDQTPLRNGQITTLELRNEFRKSTRLPIMLGDDNFVSLVRKGVEEGRFIYKSGDLLLGPDDPWAQVRIDQQSVVHTMEYAREHGIWPRTAPEAPSPVPESPPPVPEPPPSGPPEPPRPPSFHAEAPLREALTRIWEQARGAKAERISTLSLRLFEPTDAFRLFTAVSSVAANAEKHLKLSAGYETGSGSVVEVSFEGAPGDLPPLKDYLEPQFRAAKETDLTQAACTLRFKEGLPLGGDEPEKLTERLARFASGSALVEAMAET